MSNEAIIYTVFLSYASMVSCRACFEGHGLKKGLLTTLPVGLETLTLLENMLNDKNGLF